VLDAVRQRLFHPPRFWRINFLVWCGIAVLAFCTRFIMHQDFERAIALTLGAETLGFLFSGILQKFYRSLGAGVFHSPRLILQVALLTLFTGVLQAGIVQAFVCFVNWPPVRWTVWERMFLLSISMWILYLAWTLGYFWVKAELHAHKESLRAAGALADAQKMELQLLRFQLDPHFLFNTLNGIVSEIPPHPDAAMEMVGELSSYLRYSLDHRHQLLTRLAVELDAIQAYLRIQRARFGERLETSIEASQDAREALVPSFLLQPLVENAFKHGFAPDCSRWNLRISATIEHGRLLIEVRNTGELATNGGTQGVGLDTIQRRLEIHYPNRHRFAISSNGDVVTATLEMEGSPCSV
jgi:hypothetical protein